MKSIEIEHGESNIWGSITALSEEDTYIYFSAFFSEENLLEIKEWLFSKGIEEFALLRNIYVDEADRCKGTGKDLVNQFISQAKSLPIILLASPDEEDFDLQTWYEKLGFETSNFYSEGSPLMIKF